MAPPEATTRMNHDQMTPESTPGPDVDRLAADKERRNWLQIEPIPYPNSWLETTTGEIRSQ